MTDQPTDTVRPVRLTQRIAAPRETIFEFLVDPELVVRWMGTAVDITPEPGGQFWLDVNGNDIATGSYVEVVPPERVVFTWGWEGSTDVPPGSSTVTITLEADGDDTVVELLHGGLPGGPADEHAKGWTPILARLASAATGGHPDPADLPGA